MQVEARGPSVANRWAPWLLGIDSPADNTGVGSFCVPDLTGVVDFLMGQTDVGSSCLAFYLGRPTPIALTGDLTPILRGVVFIGQPALGHIQEPYQSPFGSRARRNRARN